MSKVASPAVTLEAERILNFLASLPRGITSAERPVVREIMLRTSGEMFVQGEIFGIVAKNLGAGVYRLSLKARETISAGAENDRLKAEVERLARDGRDMEETLTRLDNAAAAPEPCDGFTSAQMAVIARLDNAIRQLSDEVWRPGKPPTSIRLDWLEEWRRKHDNRLSALEAGKP